MLAFKDGERVQLVSRNGRDHTARFAEIASAVARLPTRTLILDGEVCAFDAQLISHIYLLDGAPEAPATPPVFIAFDCMYRRGRDLRDRPLSHRRCVLEGVTGDGHHVYAARRLSPHGLDAWAEIKPRNYEGLVAKREASRYRAGRTRDWLKVKLRDEGRFVVVGLDFRLPVRAPFYSPRASGAGSRMSVEPSGACRAGSSRSCASASGYAPGRAPAVSEASGGLCG